MPTYVYSGVEVKLTGRTASKEVEKVERRSGKKTKGIQILHEVTPTSNLDGSWKKWIDKEELFVVSEDHE